MLVSFIIFHGLCVSISRAVCVHVLMKLAPWMKAQTDNAQTEMMVFPISHAGANVGAFRKGG